VWSREIDPCEGKSPDARGSHREKYARPVNSQCFSAPEAAPGAPAFEPGETLLPEPQSLLAIFEEVALLLVPAPELPVGAFDALLSGPQLVWCMPLAVAFVLVVPLELELVPVLPVLLVCAMAAVPRLRAKIDAAVKIRRFIWFPPTESTPG
jgi:hypothetical protein